MVFLIIIFCVIASLTFISKKYDNPYKLFFIFGKKGAGKSTFMVKKMLHFMRKGWIVYTDVPDIFIPGIRHINVKDLSTFTPEEHSAVFLDEVGISFDNRNFKSFDSGLRDFFKFQRKYKVRIYMNSQAFDIDKKIRDVTDKMYLCSSFCNAFCIVRPISRRVTLTEPSADNESRIADSLRFDSIFNWQIIYMPNYHKYFNSFSAPERAYIPYELIGEIEQNEMVMVEESASE